MQFTGERIEKNQRNFKKRFADHIKRYDFAKQYIQGKNVLDIACGTWYGSYELACAGALSVTWVDIDSDAIAIAKHAYNKENLTFEWWDGETIPFANDSIDVVISFETIEHIENYKWFLSEIQRVLKKNGKLILSTPNYRGELVKNHFHVSNFTDIHLVDIVEQYFQIDKHLYQGRHFFPFPWRWILETLLFIHRDTDIYAIKPGFPHHVTILVCTKV